MAVKQRRAVMKPSNSFYRRFYWLAEPGQVSPPAPSPVSVFLKSEAATSALYMQQHHCIRLTRAPSGKNPQDSEVERIYSRLRATFLVLKGSQNDYLASAGLASDGSETKKSSDETFQQLLQTLLLAGRAWPSEVHQLASRRPLSSENPWSYARPGILRAVEVIETRLWTKR